VSIVASSAICDPPAEQNAWHESPDFIGFDESQTLLDPGRVVTERGMDAGISCGASAQGTGSHPSCGAYILKRPTLLSSMHENGIDAPIKLRIPPRAYPFSQLRVQLTPIVVLSTQSPGNMLEYERSALHSNGSQVLAAENFTSRGGFGDVSSQTIFALSPVPTANP
jgi:hypothetical protein